MAVEENELTALFVLDSRTLLPRIAERGEQTHIHRAFPLPLVTTETKCQGMITTASGLQYEDTQAGEGATAVAGKTCVMHYTGWLWEAGKKGSKFDSSVDRGQPFSFRLGAGQVIRGWDEGVAGINIGGKRTLLIPADLGYGARGAGGVIPPNATLLFEVELLDLR